MPTITEQIARWAAGLTYDDLTPEAVDAAKRFLYDTIGCALGGSQVHDCQMFLQHYRDLQQPGPCTVIGAGDKMNPVAAAMLNALMVRAMDYNDIYWKQDPAHPSDLASAPLAIAEWKHLSGKDLLLGLVLAWDLTQRLCHIAVPGIRERGWHHATLMAYAAPVVAGKLLGLTPEQMQHAIGIASCHSFTLGCAVAGKLTMMKNTVSPMATRNGVEAALLAQRGYTGPEGVIEGKEGMQHCLGDGWDYSWITDKLPSTTRKDEARQGEAREGDAREGKAREGEAPAEPGSAGASPSRAGTSHSQGSSTEGRGWMITQCGMKSFPIEALMHSPVSATLQIIKENDLKPEDITEVRIDSIARAADILSDPAKYDPQSKESADHSLPYCIAAAVTDRCVTPRQFKDERLWDDRLRAQMKKVKVVANDEFERAFPARQCTRVTITTADGRRLTAERDYPKGDPRDPMTIPELDEKFTALAEPIMSAARRAELKRAIFDLENLHDAGTLMALTAADI